MTVLVTSVISEAHLLAPLVMMALIIPDVAQPPPVPTMTGKFSRILLCPARYVSPYLKPFHLISISFLIFITSTLRDENGSKDEDGSINPGSNLFVTGIHPRLTEAEVTRLFEKYGEVEKCQIMKDPHTKESRGFGFVKMVTSEQADAAKDGLQGEEIEGRTLSIEKARRARPRTPTPGKYFGPPKRG